MRGRKTEIGEEDVKRCKSRKRGKITEVRVDETDAFAKRMEMCSGCREIRRVRIDAYESAGDRRFEKCPRMTSESKGHIEHTFTALWREHAERFREKNGDMQSGVCDRHHRQSIATIFYFEHKN